FGSNSPASGPVSTQIIDPAFSESRPERRACLRGWRHGVTARAEIQRAKNLIRRLCFLLADAPLKCTYAAFQDLGDRQTGKNANPPEHCLVFLIEPHCSDRH